MGKRIAFLRLINLINLTEISGPVASLSIDMVSERVIPCPQGFTSVPSFPHEQVAWGFADQSVKLLVDKKVTSHEVCSLSDDLKFDHLGDSSCRVSSVYLRCFCRFRSFCHRFG